MKYITNTKEKFGKAFNDNQENKIKSKRQKPMCSVVKLQRLIASELWINSVVLTKQSHGFKTFVVLSSVERVSVHPWKGFKLR